eukprot:11665525-Alexandrium_andersonii.AAC.1
MSASLVGSEMCIRDSPCCIVRWEAAFGWPERASVERAHPFPMGGGGGGCLLYTSDAADDM